MGSKQKKQLSRLRQELAHQRYRSTTIDANVQRRLDWAAAKELGAKKYLEQCHQVLEEALKACGGSLVLTKPPDWPHSIVARFEVDRRAVDMMKFGSLQLIIEDGIASQLYSFLKNPRVEINTNEP